ncbi:Lanthionine synthetase C-like protein [Promicromonospora umidemergens]|uniref:Lanthionine synthetase C family protein n=1 Tax=Promicromonospora umidemergens TaxID=629679 RepID=A0ABP8WFW8_9MICO|nr:lanthionine synthetase C family protein [Promicromonospora umidemergens]MCP2286553.1 Lanthionine synthetase C-like protein [Promicromonospora umidemergens]
MTNPDTIQTQSITRAAEDLVGEIAQRLTDPARYQHGNGRARRQSLGGGAIGIALLHIERARTGHGDWATVHAWLREAAREPLSAGVNAGLFYGTPALALALHTAADETEFSSSLSRLDRAVATVIRQRLGQARARLRSRLTPPMGEYDLIRGLAGLGAYHLRRHPDDDLTIEVLDYLVRLTDTLPGHEDLPGWWTHTAPTKETAGTARFADGHANLSMSHGSAAVLAVLASALRQGVRVRDHEAAIGRICSWYDTLEQHDETGTWWPSILTPAQVRGHEPPSPRQRASWCYGTLGIARALQLVALATGDEQRLLCAESALLNEVRSEQSLATLTDVGLCHGLAGVLQTAWRASVDAATPDLANEVVRLTRAVVEQTDSLTEQTEFLDGLAGVALALHTVTTGHREAQWDTCLLLN